MFASVIQKKIFALSFEFERGIIILNEPKAIIVYEEIMKRASLK